MDTAINLSAASQTEIQKEAPKVAQQKILTEAQIENKLKKRELTIRTITIISTFIGAAWGLWQYLEKRQQEIDTRRHEYEFASFKEQKETLYPLCTAAAEIIASKNLEDAQKSIREFEIIYYGQVGIIADDSTAKVAQSFASAVAEYKLGVGTDEPPSILIQILGELTSKCKKNLALDNMYKRKVLVAAKSPR